MEKGQALPMGNPPYPPSNEVPMTPSPPYPGPPVDPNMGHMGPQVQQPAYYAPQYAPQQAPQYAPQQAQIIQPVQTVVMVQPTPTDVPVQMLCPRCQNTVVTRVEHKPGTYAWMFCVLLGVFLIWPCCLIPFCVDGCKDAHHYCPSCNNVVHIHRRA